jgi:hypothetical protein
MCNLYSELKAKRLSALRHVQCTTTLATFHRCLRSADEIELWMSAPINEALALQRPLPDGTLSIVRSGVQEDVLTI